MEVDFHIPVNYPLEHPNILVRTDGLNKDSHGRMMTELKQFMVDLSEDISIPSIISWLQENIDSFKKPLNQVPQSYRETCVSNNEENFSRLWIRSHHIYSSKKRKAIALHAKQLNLNGLCVAGKPGIIIVEGIKCCVEEFWTIIHSMQWQKIAIKEREDFKVSVNESNSLVRFDTFQECQFSDYQSHNSEHGGFFSFLEEKGFGHMFHCLFGLSGKSRADKQS